MKGYFYTIIITSVAGTICTVLADGYEKYIKYIAALISALVIILPLKNSDISSMAEKITENTENISLSDSDGLNQLSADMTEKRTEEYICNMVLGKFGIKPTFCRIDIDWNKEEPVIENITVALSKEDTASREAVKGYLFEVLGGEVEVIEG